ncbi:MAG: ergothioneine biosynthesis glutamate--cysteine ligase EgtA [Acidimicrobiia bacterium]|nr:ergothioneine biosynthesis glutamate--cysteine ligase EgtA [Acidimicrobiia bacterium]
MPGPDRSLTLGEARDHVLKRCFTPGGVDLVGLETEWLVTASDDPSAHVPFAAVQTATARSQPLPAESVVTYEPGGQLELSGLPVATVGAACEAMHADVVAVQRSLAAVGLTLVGEGSDAVRSPRRVVHTPRYAAMEAYFDGDGPAGKRMMSSTAALQVNLGLGDSEGCAEERWLLAHTLGPTLVASFANSPMRAGQSTGWKSSRLATWWEIDPTRTAPAPLGGGVSAWASYALDARVMFIRESTDRYMSLDGPLSFTRWILEGHELGHPTIDDLDYHLTTIFPPVRPRGWLEFRYLDALPDPWWRVAATVVCTLLLDDEAKAAAFRATEGTEELWLAAARWGLEHPALATAARESFEAAMEAAPRAGADPESVHALANYYDRYVARRRCPADDRLVGGRV